MLPVELISEAITFLESEEMYSLREISTYIFPVIMREMERRYLRSEDILSLIIAQEDFGLFGRLLDLNPVVENVDSLVSCSDLAFQSLILRKASGGVGSICRSGWNPENDEPWMEASDKFHHLIWYDSRCLAKVLKETEICKDFFFRYWQISGENYTETITLLEEVGKILGLLPERPFEYLVEEWMERDSDLFEDSDHEWYVFDSEWIEHLDGIISREDQDRLFDLVNL